MCYNTTYKSPPKVRQSGLEPEYRLHGSAFQKHRVCHFTTGALIEQEGSGQHKSYSPLGFSIYIHLQFVLSLCMVTIRLIVANTRLKLPTNNSIAYLSIPCKEVENALLSLLWL